MDISSNEDYRITRRVMSVQKHLGSSNVRLTDNSIATAVHINLDNAQIFLYKSWRPKFFFHFHL